MENRPRRPWIAALLSIAALGLGHVYVGRWRRGLFFAAIGIVWTAGIATLVVTPVFLAAAVVGVLGSMVLTIVALVDSARLASRHSRDYEPRPYNRVAVYVLLLCLAWFGREGAHWLMQDHLVRAARIPSGSMSNTLLEGDFLFLDARETARQAARGALVVYRSAADPRVSYVKRVVAVAGDTVAIRDKVLRRNGREIDEPYVVHTDRVILPATFGPRDNMDSFVVPPDHCFVLGDSRDVSNDSRHAGPIHVAQVLGRPIGIYWSWDREANEVRWRRVGLRLR